MPTFERIESADIQTHGMVGAPTVLTGTPEENKARFDELVREVVAQRVNRIIEQAGQIEENEEERQGDEQDRATAEAARAAAESARVAAESARAGAETAREQAETARADAEDARAAAEANSAIAEIQRAAAEIERATAEAQRVEQESSRAAAEANRALAEIQRAAAESERATTETARDSAEALRAATESARANAEAARVQAEAQRVSETEGVVARAAAQADDAAQSASNAFASETNAAAQADLAQQLATFIQSVQAALHLRRRFLFGTSTDMERMQPGDVLILTDDSSIEHQTDLYDLLAEAQKAAAGLDNDLETLAVLSVVNATNIRRDADGAIWTTDTVAEFRQKLTSLAAAAVAAGYVDEDGRCLVTWAQAQGWFITGELLSPLDAESVSYDWRSAQGHPELQSIRDDVTAIRQELWQAAKEIGELVTGGDDNDG